MKIFKNNNEKLSEINNLWFLLEKDMQKLIEKNLEKTFSLEFISTEFQIWDLRIDTLAFDRENNSFVIIEYKRWNSYSVIDQAMSYLALMLNNKPNFTEELSRKRQNFIDSKTIEWSQSRIIIVADGFNKYQKESINFKDLPVELYECKKFENDLIVLNSINSKKSTESFKHITNFETREFEKVTKELKTYIEEDLLKKSEKNILEMYEELKEFIFDLDSEILMIPKKFYIAFKKGWKNYFDFEIRKNFIKIFLNLKKWELKFSENLIDVSNIWHYWNWDYVLRFEKREDIFDVKEYIKQTYRILNKKTLN